MEVLLKFGNFLTEKGMFLYRLCVKRCAVIAILLSLFTILPFIAAMFYTQPYYDDFYFSSVLAKMNPFAYTHFFYFQWSGRYSAVFLFACYNAHIVHASNIYYTVYGLLILTGLFISVYLLVHYLLGNSTNKTSKFAITSVVIALYVNFMPEIFSAFYWHCATIYQFNLIFLLISFAFILKKFNPDFTFKKADWIILVFSTIFVAGASEVIVIDLLLLYGACVFYCLVLKKSSYKFWLLLLGIMLVFGTIMIVAPGNFARMNDSVHEPRNMVAITGRSVYDFFVFNMVSTFFSSPTGFLLVLSIPFILKIKSKLSVSLFNVHPAYSALVLVAIFISQHFLSLFGGGYSLQGRVFNISEFLMILAFLYLIISMIVRSTMEAPASLDFIKPVLLGIVFIFIFSANNRLVISELVRTLPTLKKEMTQRYQLIETAKNNNDTAIVVPPVTVNPRLFCLGEFKPDTIAYNSKKYLSEMSKFYKIHVSVAAK